MTCSQLMEQQLKSVDSRRLATSRELVGLVIIVLIVILLGRNSFRLGWPR